MNAKNTRLPPNHQILDEASGWFVDFRAGDIDARARQAFHEWLRRSPDHIQAYLDIAATYAELPDPTTNGELDVQALIDKARASADLNVVPLETRSARASLERRHKFSGKRVLAIAASLMLTALALGSWLYIERDTYSTGVGEQRSLTLADGSTVELNSRSRIRVRYTDDERRIDLLEGQALFQVTKNKQRPFIVDIDNTQVRAVGTQFDVYRKRSGTVVTVVEGRVAVLPASEVGTADNVEPAAEALAVAETPAIFLAAGEQLTVSQKTATQPQAVNPKTATAWTQRHLVFESASLNEVAEEFNRYSARPIVIEDREFDTFHVSGTYSSTNPESLLRFLRIQPGIKVIESDREIRITRE
jgi:transmembrane sensor